MIDILYKVGSIEYTSMLTSIYNAVESGRGIVSIDKLGIEDGDDREDEETNKLFEAI